MKRMNVIVDEELLEKARRVSGERTYSGAMNVVLNDYVRRQDFRDALRKAREVAGEDFFAPGYVEEMWPEIAPAKKRARISAGERRAPQQKKSRRRDPR